MHALCLALLWCGRSNQGSGNKYLFTKEKKIKTYIYEEPFLKVLFTSHKRWTSVYINFSNSLFLYEIQFQSRKLTTNTKSYDFMTIDWLSIIKMLKEFQIDILEIYASMCCMMKVTITVKIQYSMFPLRISNQQTA